MRAVQFGVLEETGGAHIQGSIDLLQDVPLVVRAELGQSKMLVKEILRLGVGSVVALDKEAGELVDVLVNNKLIARGEVVEIEGHFGVKITEILSKR